MFYLTIRHNDKEYTLEQADRDLDGFEFWLSNELGESMSLSEKNLFDIINEYFNREF